MKVLNPEVQPKITDLAVWNDDGDVTDDFLTGTRLLITIQSVSKTTDSYNYKISDLLPFIRKAEVWTLTSSSANEYENFAKQAGWTHPYYYVDSTVLKAMIRSSPGIILMRDGVVLGKWHFNDIPSASEISRLIP